MTIDLEKISADGYQISIVREYPYGGITHGRDYLPGQGKTLEDVVQDAEKYVFRNTGNKSEVDIHTQGEDVTYITIVSEGVVRTPGMFIDEAPVDVSVRITVTVKKLENTL